MFRVENKKNKKKKKSNSIVARELAPRRGVVKSEYNADPKKKTKQKQKTFKHFLSLSLSGLFLIKSDSSTYKKKKRNLSKMRERGRFLIKLEPRDLLRLARLLVKKYIYIYRKRKKTKTKSRRELERLKTSFLSSSSISYVYRFLWDPQHQRDEKLYFEWFFFSIERENCQTVFFFFLLRLIKNLFWLMLMPFEFSSLKFSNIFRYFFEWRNLWPRI